MQPSKNIGILGYGEVGKAMASFYDQAVRCKLHIQDIGTGPDADGVARLFPTVQLDILHVCIPYSPTFIADVLKVIERRASAAVVFIHSTVPVGTTFEIAKVHSHTVHTPVRGVHPNLAEGIKTFVKYVGADSSGVGRLAEEHLREIGIAPLVLFKSTSTELLKLLDTTYYGLAIAYHAYAKALCDKVEVNFDMVMTDANKTYNEGYALLGKDNVVRPVLFAPEGPIGGHCVIPNAALLLEQFGEDPILQAILRHK